MKHRAKQFELPIVENLRLVSEECQDGERVQWERRQREIARARQEAAQVEMFDGPIRFWEAK